MNGHLMTHHPDVQPEGFAKNLISIWLTYEEFPGKVSCSNCLESSKDELPE